jgi:reverse gyrase
MENNRLTHKLNGRHDTVCGSNWLFYGDGLQEILTKLGKIEDLMDEYDIHTIEKLSEILDEYQKNSEELYFCERCGCQSLRESDRYCPECGGRVDD